MDILVFLLVGLVLAIIIVAVFISLRQRRAQDYQERLNAADLPGRAHNEAQAKAYTAGFVRSGVGRFGP